MMTLEQQKAGDQPETNKLEQGKVEVNQRGLIRKILSRYSYEFAVFRELLQNSDDARSDNVIIRFENDKTPSGISATCIIENSGDPFAEQDWDRLKVIADGNPDSGKVGAFGVGFYTIFSVTDHPVVLSGGRKMEFYWEGKAGPLCYCLSEHRTPEKGTIIRMLLKNAEIPEIDDLFRFLATSITFMTHVKNIEVFLNKVTIGRFSKSKENLEDLKSPIEMEPVSPSDMRFLEPLKLQRRQFTIEYFPDPEEQPSMSSKLGLGIFSVKARVEMHPRLQEELFQCTSKDRAPQVKYSLIYTGKEEYDKSSADTEHSMVFQGLRADLNEALHSKIFIGHSTRQTTGIGGHMESQFIPTVERESIDLVDKNVAIWNNSLLYLGSFLSRVIYELELSDIQTTWIRLDESEASEAPDFEPLRERFIHVLRFFTFRTSTPSSKIAEKLCASFDTCSTSPLRLLSSVGVRQVSDVRLYDNLCEKFLKDVPMLSSDSNNLAVDFVKAQQQEIQPIKPSDVMHDIQKHALDHSNGELVACLQWVLGSGCTTGVVNDLLEVARFRDANKIEVPLSSIQHFINPKRDGLYIPLDGPLPRSVLPCQITQSIRPAELERFGWREFTVVDWLLHVTSQAVRMDDEGKHDFTKSPDWAEHVLHCVSSAWSSGGDIVHKLAMDIFKTEKCIPTTHGLRIPEQSYLPNSNITRFNDLDFPTVQLSSGLEISEEMVELLIALGVERHPPIELVLKHLEKWETPALIDYLVRVFANLSDSDIEKLKSSPIFPQKGHSEDDSVMSFRRANELYPPKDIFQKLGLPLIDWGESSEWQDESCKEVELLYCLDLNRFPSLEKIIELSQNAKVGEVAFEYLCNNLRKKYSDRTFEDFQDTAFVPMESRDGVDRGKLGDVFLNKQWREFGFPVVLPRYEDSVVEGLGIRRHPSPSSILRQLERFAKDPYSREDTARRWFSILSEHVSEFQKGELCLIGGLSIVPAFTREGKKMMLTPVECYLGQSAGHELYPKLFHFVDFGTGDKFLRACGAKSVPTKDDIAQKLISDPNKFYRLAGGPTQFIQQIGFLASDNPSVSNAIIENMKALPVLLGIIKNPEEAYVLRKPKEIVITNDEQTFQLFADSIVAAPRDMSRELEEFYMLLGCQPLTTAIRDQRNQFGEIEDPCLRDVCRDLVLERLPIFLHNYPRPRLGTPAARFFGANDLTVRIWQKLSISKILTEVTKNLMTSEERPVSATMFYGQNTIQLWLTYRVKEDIHDLAVSLCRAFLGTENPPDVEFLKTYMSESLDVLKRRGYKVDQQRLDGWGLPRPANPSSAIALSTSSLPVNDLTRTAELSMTKTGHGATTQDTTKQIYFPGGSEAASREVLRIPSSHPAVVLRSSPDCVMPTKDIESIIEAAIQACISRKQTPLIVPHTDPNVNNFLDGYCGVSAPVSNLRLFCCVRDVEIHVAQGHDFPDVNILNGGCIPKLLSHFLDILEPIAKVYGFSTKSYCIFATAGCIAFNHQGTIYLNLQYFEKWHYKDVCDGRHRRALTLWFLTFAHEIAHNLVADHDSEHEFWFLVICEKYMDKFLRLLGPASA